MMLLLGAYPSEKDRLHQPVISGSMIEGSKHQMHCCTKVFHVYMFKQSRNTIGHRGDFKAEADVDTDGSPTRLPGSATQLHVQHVAGVL